jgi:outer membrane protein OmpA-like peptidoglycan-associated protein
MAGGIKKIKYVSGNIFLQKSVPNKSISIAPDQTVWFAIGEWYSDTTPQQKKQDSIWLFQEGNRKVLLSKTVVGHNEWFGVKLTKKLCGAYQYYLEASFTGDRNSSQTNPTGLVISGYCPPKITASKWCVSSDGSPAGKQKQFDYGERVYLNLETEGMDGLKNVVVEVYRRKALSDQLMYTMTKVPVEDGEINLEINKTSMWFALAGHPTGVEEYYVQVKLANGTYVLDDHNDTEHARFLRIKPEQVQQKLDAPKNTTALKIGKPDENKKNYHPCRFSQINIEDKGNTTVFDEGVTKLKHQRNTTRNTKQLVHFDFDKDNLRTDARQILDRLLDFLLYNPHLDIMLEGHADDRGELDYNQALSERRADTVKKYFFDKGLKQTRIITRGFGEARNLVKANNEEQHSKNRRTEIEFSYIDYDSDAIVYETIAGSVLKPKKVVVKLLKHEVTQCPRSDDKHTKEITVKFKDQAKKKVGSEGTLNLSNCVPPHFTSMYAYYLLQYLTPLVSLQNKYTLDVHTCAYYADKHYPTLDFRVYPDLVWIANLQYNFATKGDYFFHNKKLELTTGIKEVLDEYRKSLWSKILGYLPTNYFTQDLIFDYIEKQANDYSYGGHIIYERDIEEWEQPLSLTGTTINLIKDTKYTKYAAAAVIYGLVATVIIIDLIVIYLTRGRNLAGRAGKISKVLRKVKALEKTLERVGDVDIEIIPPSIAVNAGMYYSQQVDKRVAMIYEANIKADPLLAIEIKKEFDLADLLDKGINIGKSKTPIDKQTKEQLAINKPNTTKIKDHFNSLGISVKGEIIVTGEIGFEHNVTYNALTKQHTIIDILGNGIITHSDEMLLKAQIVFFADIKAKFKKEFDFIPLQPKIEGKLDIKLKGGLGMKLKYGVTPNKGLYLQQTLFFSGITGIYLGSFKLSSRNIGEIIEGETNDGKPTPFTLIEPFEMDMIKIQLFDQDKNDW